MKSLTGLAVAILVGRLRQRPPAKFVIPYVVGGVMYAFLRHFFAPPYRI